jgi:hypothetical protein
MLDYDNFRYERKFLTTTLSAQGVRSILRRHRAMFHEPYPPRYVNNIYMDTPEYDDYGDNLAGAARRSKVRVRWYHDLFRQVDAPVLEFKEKVGIVGWKEHHNFPGFKFDREFSPRDFERLIRGSELPTNVKIRLSRHRPTLANRYWRFYFATLDERFRVTVDNAPTYYKVNRLKNRFIVRQVDHNVVIVELKYDRAYEAEANRIASSFPFRLSRSSKYVQGINAFYLW